MGEILLAEGKPREAIAEFVRADSIPDGPAHSCNICLLLDLGRAYDAAGVADSAIVMFERYLATPSAARFGINGDVTALAPMYRRLGELYEAKSDTAKATAYFQKFVDLWKNADPVLQPQVAEARRRLARLQAGQRR
jgi:tetratricopeptide (TPR) repeat protein